MCSKFQQFSEFETMSSEICFSDCSVLNVTTCEELAPPKLHKVKKNVFYYCIIKYYCNILKYWCNCVHQICWSTSLNNLLFKKGKVWNKNWFDCHFYLTFDQVLKTFFRSSMMKMDATQGQTTLGRETSICIKFLVFKIISIKSIISCLSIIIFIQLVISWCLSSQFCNLVIDLDGQIINTEMNDESKSVICEI